MLLTRTRSWSSLSLVVLCFTTLVPGCGGGKDHETSHPSTGGNAGAGGETPTAGGSGGAATGGSVGITGGAGGEMAAGAGGEMAGGVGGETPAIGGGGTGGSVVTGGSGGTTGGAGGKTPVTGGATGTGGEVVAGGAGGKAPVTGGATGTGGEVVAGGAGGETPAPGGAGGKVVAGGAGGERAGGAGGEMAGGGAGGAGGGPVACIGDTYDDDLNPDTPCVAKTQCNPGEYVVSDGSAIANRTCSACAGGEYSATTNAEACAAWRVCGAGTEPTNTPDASTDRTCGDCEEGEYSAGPNTVCETCSSGTWDDDANPSTACVAWTDCGAGTEPTNTPDASTNRTCGDCGEGEWSPGSNAACQAWTECGVGSQPTNTPSATQDRTCGVCGPSGWSAGGNTLCVDLPPLDLGAESLLGAPCPDMASDWVVDMPNPYTIVHDPVSPLATEGCLSPGDFVLIINLQGHPGDVTNVGNWEILPVAATGGGLISLDQEKAQFYGEGPTDENLGSTSDTQRVMVMKVPTYPVGTLPPGVAYTAPAWDGTQGGVFAMNLVGGPQLIEGVIDMSGKGYRGGEQNSVVNTTGQQGESIAGLGVNAQGPNLGGGGGGFGDGQCDDAGFAGGGASYFGLGTNAAQTCGGLAGTQYATPTRLYLGSGGGAGGSDNVLTDNPPGAPGGAGGGIVLLFHDGDIGGAISVNVSGSRGVGDPVGVECAHGNSTTACYDYSGPSGGGSGGSIWMQALAPGLNGALSYAVGGPGGNGWDSWAGDAGDGGDGTIDIL